MYIVQVDIIYLYHVLNIPGEEGEDADLDAPKVYEPIESYEQLSEKLISYQTMYNETVRGGKMDLVFFKVHVI